jgi:hypothetical protein
MASSARRNSAAGFRFECLGSLRPRLDRKQRKAEQFETKRFDRRVILQQTRNPFHQRLARGKNLLQ